MVDNSLVLRKVADLQRYLEQVREFAGITIEAYESDWRTQRIVERTLQMIIETCVDIAHHIISGQGMRIPASYADAFKVLAENLVIESELLVPMDRMAKFRNVVVHQYEEVDAEIVIAILTKGLPDLEKYIAAILNYLKRDEELSGPS